MTDIPKTMRATMLTGHGGLDKLAYREAVKVPAPAPGEVLIRVGACGMNNTDINTRTGWYAKEVRQGTTAEGGREGFSELSSESGSWGGSSLTFPRIQGADVAGEVVGLGEGADTALMGRRVLIDTWLRDPDAPRDMSRARYFGSETDGGYAEYTVAPATNVYPVESPLTDIELATFATSYITAENMLVRAEVGTGDVVLIPGASGGVGSALIQLARRRGAVAIAMCGDDKAEQVKALGPEAVLPRSPKDLRASLKAATGREDVDVVADVVGGPLWGQMIEALARGGRYTCAGAIAGPIVEFDLRTFYLNDLTFTGATVVAPGLFANLVSYIEQGDIRPLVAGIWPLHELAAAQEAFLAKSHIGNIVIDVAGKPG